MVNSSYTFRFELIPINSLVRKNNKTKFNNNLSEALLSI